MRTLFFCVPSLSNTKTRSLVTNMQNPLPGAEVGIPLTLFENIFTNMHYGYDITTSKIILLQFAFAFITYGSDRFRDAYDPLELKADKQKMYEYYRDNKEFIAFSLAAAYFLTFYLLIQEQETIPFIIAISSTFKYKEYKSLIGPVKSTYIALMWTLGCYILPCVITDHNYSSLLYPLDYMPIFLTLFGSSNLADTKDMVEDKNNNINTLPVIFGEEVSNTISSFCILLSSLIFFNNHNFDKRLLINSIYSIQNTVIGLIPILTNSTIIKLP